MESFYLAFLNDVSILVNVEKEIRTSSTSIVSAKHRAVLTELYDKYKYGDNDIMVTEFALRPAYDNGLMALSWIAAFWTSINGTMRGEFGAVAVAMAKMIASVGNMASVRVSDLINQCLTSTNVGVVSAARSAQEVIGRWKIRYPNAIASLNLRIDKGQSEVMLTIKEAVQQWLWYCNPDRYDEGLFLSSSMTGDIDHLALPSLNGGVTVYDVIGTMITNVNQAIPFFGCWTNGQSKRGAILCGRNNGVAPAVVASRIFSLNAKKSIKWTSAGGVNLYTSSSTYGPLYSSAICHIAVGGEKLELPSHIFTNDNGSITPAAPPGIYGFRNITLQARRRSDGTVIDTRTFEPSIQAPGNTESWAVPISNDDVIDVYITGWELADTPGQQLPATAAANIWNFAAASVYLYWTQATSNSIYRRVIDAVSDGITDIASPNLGWADTVNMVTSCLSSYNKYLKGLGPGYDLASQLDARYGVVGNTGDYKNVWGPEVYNLSWWFSYEPALTSATASILYRYFYEMAKFQLTAMLVDGGYHDYLKGL